MKVPCKVPPDKLCTKTNNAIMVPPKGPGFFWLRPVEAAGVKVLSEEKHKSEYWSHEDLNAFCHPN